MKVNSRLVRKLIVAVCVLAVLVSLLALWLVDWQLLVLRVKRGPDGLELTHLYLLSINPLRGIREVSCLDRKLTSHQAPQGLSNAFTHAVRQAGVNCRH